MMKQSHNKNKIRKASRYTGGEFSHSDDVNYTAWKEFILSRLDGDRTFKGIDSDKHDDYLRSIWEALATGIHLMHSASGDSVNIPAGFRSLAKRMSKEKVLHFKDGKSFAEYNKKFGDGSLRETMLKSLKASADNTAMMRQLGPNPQQTLDSIFHNLQKYAADKYGTKGREMMGSRKAMDFYMSEVDGSLNIPANQMLATVSSNIRVVNSLSKLGKAAISSVTDLVYSASEFNYQGAGFLTGYKSALSGLTSGKTTAEQTELLSMLGVTMRGMIGDNIDRYSAQDSISGGMSKLMRVYFKANMLTQWTDSLRKGVSLGFSTNIAKNTHLSYNDLGDDLKRMWGLFGIEPEMWNMIRKVDTHKIDGDSFFTPEMAREIPDSDVINFLNDRGLPASETRINNIRAEIETKFRNYFSDRVEYAVLEPDARVRALSKMGLQAGTPVGEAARFITQFKSFPLTVLMKPLARDIWGRGIEESAFHKAMWQALTRGNGENIALAHTIVMSTALGYVSLVLKDLVNNKTPRDPTDPETITASMAAGGGLGIYTDFILGELRTSYGSGPISQLAGPTFGTGEDIVNIYSKMLDGDFDEAQYQSLNTVINNTPFSNLFYTRMALDYLILYNIKESMNSGFIERMERRAAETGQEFIISPR